MDRSQWIDYKMKNMSVQFRCLEMVGTSRPVAAGVLHYVLRDRGSIRLHGRTLALLAPNLL